MSERPEDQDPEAFAAVLASASDKIESVGAGRMTTVRVGWKPSSAQRAAACWAGFLVLGPSEPEAGWTRAERALIEEASPCSCRDNLDDPNRKRTCARHGIEPFLRVKWPFGT